jgi:hypothetical protein
VAAGEARYFTGKMCKNGHIRDRYAINGACVGCDNANEVRRRALRYAAQAGRAQPVCCEVCGKRGRIVFDHDHATGKFRGWLCNHCNLSIGHALDDPALLRRLAEYLEKHNGKTDGSQEELARLLGLRRPRPVVPGTG